MLTTDDEIVAASAVSDRRWTGLLPSVDPEVETALSDAAIRGARSLAERGLLIDDAALGSGAEELDAALNGAARVTVYAAAEEVPLAPIASSVSVIESEGSWLIDVAAPEGAHDLFRVESPRGAREVVEKLLATADALPDGRVLSMIAVSPDSVTSAFVAVKGDTAISAPFTNEVPGGSQLLGAMSAADALALVLAVAGL